VDDCRRTDVQLMNVSPQQESRCLRVQRREIELKKG
jgi:hypothetical protein